MRRSVRLIKSLMWWTRRMWLISRWLTSFIATLILLRQSCIHLMLRLRYLISIRTKHNPQSTSWSRAKAMQTSLQKKVKKRRKENTQVKDQQFRNMGLQYFSQLKKSTLVLWSQIPQSTGLSFFTIPILSRGCFIWSIKKRLWYGIIILSLFLCYLVRIS